MDCLQALQARYSGQVQLAPPASAEDIQAAEGRLNLHVPDQLAQLLRVSNGVQELLCIGDKIEPIGPILYSLEDMVQASCFYRATYGVRGIVFTCDGAGDVYYLDEAGIVWYYHPISGEQEAVAASLQDFFAPAPGN